MDDSLGSPKPYQNIPSIFGFLIANHACTLHELRTVYSYQDVYYMYEAFAIPKYNEWRESKALESKGQK